MEIDFLLYYFSVFSIYSKKTEPAILHYIGVRTITIRKRTTVIQLDLRQFAGTVSPQPISRQTLYFINFINYYYYIYFIIFS